MALNPFKHDDPFRVAPPYQAPGEVEPAEPEVISDNDAARTVAEAIANNGKAYGFTADAWADEITNLYVKEQRDLVLAALFPSAYPTQAHRARKRILELCGEIANEYQPDD